MITQAIKGFLLFFSVIFTILALFEWIGDARAYQGLLGTAFILLLASNIVDLIDRWQDDRRKQDLGIDERELSRLLTREAE